MRSMYEVVHPASLVPAGSSILPKYLSKARCGEGGWIGVAGVYRRHIHFEDATG